MLRSKSSRGKCSQFTRFILGFDRVVLSVIADVSFNSDFTNMLAQSQSFKDAYMKTCLGCGREKNAYMDKMCT